MMDDRARSQHFVECSVCGRNVTYFCVQCKEDLCETCEEQHKTHDVLLYREKYATFYPEKCSAHLQESYSSFCRKCEISLCGSCVQSLGHSGHLLVDIKTAYDEHRQNYRQWCYRIRSEQLPRCQIQQGRVDEELEERRALFRGILDRIENQSVKLKSLITELVDDNKKVLKDLQSTQLNALERTKSELLSYSTHLSEILDGFEKSASYPARFLSYVKTHQKLELRCPNVPDFPVPFYEQGDLNEEDIRKLIGRIETKAPRPTSRTPSVIPEPSFRTLSLAPGPSFRTPSKAALRQKIEVQELTSIRHISHFGTNQVWVSDSNNLVCKDLDTTESTQKLSVCKDGYGCHTINDKGELFYIDTNLNILKWSEKKKDELRPVVEITKPWIPMSVHFSRQTNTLLVGMVVPLKKAKVVRYNDSGQVVQSIEDDREGHALYEAPAYITDNLTGDVIVSDYKKNAVVVVDRDGGHRFSYRGPVLGFLQQLWPRGVTTDNQANILVSNFNTRNCVHVADKDGHFLKVLEIDFGLLKPFGLTYDHLNGLIMAGSCHSQTLHVQHYLA